MPRLIDLLLTHGADTVAGEHLVHHPPREIAPDWKDTEVVVADNVAQYFYGFAREQGGWHIERDFPDLAPIYPSLWIEMRAPKHLAYQEGSGLVRDDEGLLFMQRTVDEWGVRFRADDLSRADERDRHVAALQVARLPETDPALWDTLWSTQPPPADAEARWQKARQGAEAELAGRIAAGTRWSVIAELYIHKGPGPDHLMGPVYSFEYDVLSDGSVADWSRHGLRGDWSMLQDPPEGLRVHWQSFAEGFYELMLPAFLTLSLCHWKKTIVKAETPPAALSRAHRKRHGRPLLKYHVLDIEPFRELVEREGGARQTGLKLSLHRCRGHFKVYTADAPLFGKYTGRFWWQPQLRGSIEQGRVVKDYDVHPEEDHANDGRNASDPDQGIGTQERGTD